MSSAASTRRSGGKSGSTRKLPEPAIEDAPSPARKLGITHLLVCVDGTDTDRAVLDQAMPIALRFGSHIDVLHVRFDVHGASVERQERPIDRLLDKPVEQLVAESAARARGHFEAWYAQCKLPLRDGGTAVLGPSTAGARSPAMRTWLSRAQAGSATSSSLHAKARAASARSPRWRWRPRCSRPAGPS